MHRPIRVLRSESHRGLSDAIVGSLLLGAVDWNRARCGMRCATGRSERDGEASSVVRARRPILDGCFEGQAETESVEM
jgi:hypothetical protein